VSWVVQLALPRRTRKAKPRRSFTRRRADVVVRRPEMIARAVASPWLLEVPGVRFDRARRLRGRDRSVARLLRLAPGARLLLWQHTEEFICAPRTLTSQPTTEKPLSPRTPMIRSDQKQVSRASRARIRSSPNSGSAVRAAEPDSGRRCSVSVGWRTLGSVASSSVEAAARPSASPFCGRARHRLRTS